MRIKFYFRIIMQLSIVLATQTQISIAEKSAAIKANTASLNECYMLTNDLIIENPAPTG